MLLNLCQSFGLDVDAHRYILGSIADGSRMSEMAQSNREEDQFIECLILKAIL